MHYRSYMQVYLEHILKPITSHRPFYIAIMLIDKLKMHTDINEALMLSLLIF